jgi:hypothetical protein
MLFRLRCCSWSPYSKRTLQIELLGGDGEAALVEGHERDHEPLGSVRHGLVAGHLSLHDGGEWRELACLDETKQLLAGHIGARPVRHRGGGVSSGLKAQEVAALRMWKSMGSEMRARRKKIIGKQSPEPVPNTRF